MVELRLLGPLEVRVAGDVVPLGAPKQQVVLALLATNAGRVISLDDLVTELWPEEPPASAVENARGYAASLRRLFEAVDPGRDRIIKRSTGYVLAASKDELDLLAFADECDRGRTAVAHQDLSLAATLFASALGRWRGRMLVGVPRGPALAARCAAAEEERLSLVEDLAELELTLGRHGRAVASLREHVHSHPLRERGHALLIRSVYQAGDIAGALAAYAFARARLVDELGIEPGPELQLIHAAVLRRELVQVGSLVTTSTSAPWPRVVPAPRELPPDVGSFVGRDAEIGTMLAMLRPRAQPRPTVIALHGRGGVGKSALVVRVAHLAAERFPDGQLYVDLLGSTPGLRPMAPGDGLSRFLRGLGIPQDQIPSGEADATARFRTATTGRRLLLVLDNATDTSQVLPLLPASGSCGVLVTTRQPLVALDTDLRLHMSALSRAEGVTLFRDLAGDVAVDGPTAERIVDLCEALPLAIRVAAGRMVGHPDLSSHELVERLADRRRRLDELEGPDGDGIRSSIRVGYESIAADDNATNEVAARVFRALGLLNLPDVDARVLAAMLGESTDLTTKALSRLVTAQLLIASPGERYRLHDLVRLVAAEEAQNDPVAVRDERVYRAIAFYAGSILRAESQLRPGRVPDFETPSLPADLLLPDFAGPAEAWEWTQREFENLLAAAAQAGGLRGHARRFALLICHSLWFGLHRNLEWRSAERIGPILLRTARQHGDINMKGWASLLLGQDAAEQGQVDLAMAHFGRALVILRSTDEKHGVVRALNALGIASALRGENAAAATYYDEALEVAEAARLAPSVGVVLHNLINLQLTMGHWDAAKVNIDRKLTIRRALNDMNGVGGVLGLRAVVYCHHGDLKKAAKDVEEALARFRVIGDRRRECFVLLVGAEVHRRGADEPAAMDMVRTAMSVARSSDYGYGIAAALRQQARVLAAAGQVRRAAEVRDEAELAYANLRAPTDHVLEMLMLETIPP